MSEELTVRANSGNEHERSTTERVPRRRRVGIARTQHHGSLDDLDPDPKRITTVEQYEHDVDRTEPKTIEQARENIAARINDLDAPDTVDETGTYDEPDNTRGYR